MADDNKISPLSPPFSRENLAVAESADTRDLKSFEGDLEWIRPLPAPHEFHSPTLSAVGNQYTYLPFHKYLYTKILTGYDAPASFS
jgi:hypothetical protein